MPNLSTNIHINYLIKSKHTSENYKPNSALETFQPLSPGLSTAMAKAEGMVLAFY